jgi:hypothetical protein
MTKLALLLALAVSAGPAVARAENHLMDNKKTVSYDCDKDDATNIMGNEDVITLKGACDRVNISGNHNTLTGATVKRLVVSGNENMVTIHVTEAIDVSGNKNTLAYGKSDKAPKITNSGKDNKLAVSAQ